MLANVEVDERSLLLRGHAQCTVALAINPSIAALSFKAGGSIWLKTGSHGNNNNNM